MTRRFAGFLFSAFLLFLLCAPAFAQEKNAADIVIYKKLLETIERGEISGIEKKSDAYLKSNSYLLEKSKNKTVLEEVWIKLKREQETPDGLKVPQKIEYWRLCSSWGRSIAYCSAK